MSDCSIETLEKILKKYEIEGDENLKPPISGGWGGGRIETPFDIKPSEFLKFAEDDLKIGGQHHLVNCLSNVKRSIECQIDSLLFGFGLHNRSKKEHWSFPKKVEVLNEISVVSPRLLTKINKLRNVLEHNYSLPDQERVEDALDIAVLFIKYTDKFLFSAKTSIHLDDSTGLDRVQFNCEDSKIVFSWYIRTPEHRGLDTEIVIDSNNPDFLRYIKWYVKIIELDEKF